jgi:hypothetical protein
MKKKYDIRVENSAPSQTRPAASVTWAAGSLAPEGVTSIVDLGCGRLRNLRIFREHFSDVTLVDTKLQCDRIAGKVPHDSSVRLLPIAEFAKEKREYDAVFIISVLHIIPELSDRKALLTLTRRRVRELGFLIVDVPSGEHYYSVHCTKNNRYRDGWVMGKGPIKTFYRNYKPEEIEGIVRSCTGFQLYRKASLAKHIVRIWQKREQVRNPRNDHT